MATSGSFCEMPSRKKAESRVTGLFGATVGDRCKGLA